MKKIKISLRNLALFTIVLTSLVACDKDFANIDSDIINNDNASHFETLDTLFNVIAYTKKLNPVQTNDLPVNALGLYPDPGSPYGRSSATFVSQIRGNLTDPDFGTNAVIDSVILTVPYFSTPINTTAEGLTEYSLDSVFGNGTIKLSIYESNYFLRDFDPTATDINTSQNYYANKSTGSNNINDSQLEGFLLYQNSNFKANPSQIILTEVNDENEEVESTRLAPSLRIKFDDDVQQYWQEKIIDMAGQTELSNLNNFNDYFRGVYFKAEPNTLNTPGQMLLLDMANNASNITIYYTRDPFSEDADRTQTTYTFNFTGNRVNFLANDFDLITGNEEAGDENLFLKGGQGSIAELKLFGGDDIDSDNTTDNSFEQFKKYFVDINEDDGSFIRSRKLINEANLVFYVNQTEVNGDEPNRIFLYDMNNNIPLADYFFDAENTFQPEFSRISHLGPLERENDEATGDGIRYKIKITEHLNNILLRDSTNVKLGVAVSGNINLESNTLQNDLLSENDSDKVPVSSIVSPRGTVLYGNNTLDEDKKLYLEVFFTKPNN
jgi:hypothetical protein